MPKIIACPHCNKDTYLGIPICPHCGSELIAGAASHSSATAGEFEPLDDAQRTGVLKGRWITISNEAARRHPLFGTIGWPVILIVLLVVGPAVMLFPKINAVIDLPSSAKATGWLLLLVDFAVAIWAWINAFMLGERRPEFIKSFYGYLAVTVFVPVVFAFISAGGRRLDSETTVTIFQSLVAATIWGVYVYRSRRINVTVLNRVRVGDPIIQELDIRFTGEESPDEPHEPFGGLATFVRQSTSPTNSESVSNSFTQRLSQLKSAYERGLISNAEFEAKKKEILAEL